MTKWVALGSGIDATCGVEYRIQNTSSSCMLHYHEELEPPKACFYFVQKRVTKEKRTMHLKFSKLITNDLNVHQYLFR